MRVLLSFAGGLILATASFAQTRLVASDIANHPFATDFPSAAKLKLHVRSGDIQIIGSERDQITVELSGERAQDARNLKVWMDRREGVADLRISGGPRNGITITIGIPKNTDLYARIPFGEVQVENVVGNKDIELHAGELTVSVGNSADYAHVDASVITGEVDGDPFGESRGGLFRSFRKEGSGPYRLHAHVGAGQLTLQ